jgi:hypothetical protein
VPAERPRRNKSADLEYGTLFASSNDRAKGERSIRLWGSEVKKERNAIIEKARVKKQRRDQTKLAKAINRRAGAPKSALAQKVVEMVQEAATEVSTLAKVAARKMTGSAR